MSKALGLVLILAGFLTGVGEVVHWRFFSGQLVGKYVLYDREQAAQPTPITFSSPDSSIRLEIEISGWREGVSYPRPTLAFDLTDGQRPPKSNTVSVTVRDQNDLSGYKQIPRELRAGPSQKYSRKDAYLDWQNVPPGTLTLETRPVEVSAFTYDRIEATIRSGTRPLNWALLVGAMLVFAAGVVLSSLGNRR